MPLGLYVGLWRKRTLKELSITSMRSFRNFELVCLHYFLSGGPGGGVSLYQYRSNTANFRFVIITTGSFFLVLKRRGMASGDEVARPVEHSEYNQIS